MRLSLSDRIAVGALTALLLATWTMAVVIVPVSVASAADLGTSTTWLLTSLALLVAIGLGIPLYGWIRPAVESVLFSHPEETDALIAQVAQVGRTLQPVGQSLGADLPPLNRLATQIARRLRLPYVAIVAEGSPAAESDPLSDVLARRLVDIPLPFGAERLGVLQVVPRNRERSLALTDVELLDELAVQLGIVLHATRTSALLQESRAALVQAREEERRRVRRDLHDGLGPTIASLRLHLAAIDQLMDDRPDEARVLVRRVQAEVGETSSQIRELVYGLRPPMLDELGLGGALRALAGRLDAVPRDGHSGALTVDLQLPDPMPELSAATEVALYRIASEALTNVARHSAATRVRLSLRIEPNSEVDDPRVVLEIVDDGRGLPDDLLAGIGLASMRERAEELNGDLEVVSLIAGGDFGGTSVRAVLPVGADR